MADNKKKVGHPDKDLISLTEPYEVRDWAKKFGVTQKELKAAVHKVGHSATKVKKALGK